MRSIPYIHGLHQIGAGDYVYLHPSGTWCRSNSGLVVDGDEAVLIDTQFGLAEAERLQQAIHATRPDTQIRAVVNTHGDIDHWWGNQLWADVPIIATAAAAEQMRQDRWWQLINDLKAPVPAGVREFLNGIGEAFDLNGLEPTLANELFVGERELQVGHRTVQLIDAGPAHTASDVFAHVPDARIIYAGDLVFSDTHPVIHTGPVDRWIAACSQMLSLDPAAIVPGHGPVIDSAGLLRFRSYLEHIRDHAIACQRKGISVWQAAATFECSETAHWSDADRVVINLAAVYRENEPTDASVPTELHLLGHVDATAALQG
ncbi:MBL fold metallo-hydrolase [Nocardia suismassiliense]|uniref:MBL fold metallo-hydrolase n=1 Tax=Nocardia suismassiliense TaxID=2077092 RepID=UPI00131F1E0B|nr:MBL fold metallo-hydrolase [Nocardia suismassiliense]